MKRLLFSIAIIVLFISFLGCKSDTSKESEKICNEIIGLNKDISRLPKVVAMYGAISDSLGARNESSLNLGIINGLEMQNDTLRLVGRMLCNSPEQFGSWASSKAVDEILNSKNSFDTNQKIEKRNEIICFLYYTANLQQSKVVFEKAFQDHIDSLNIRTQALIYTKMISPSTLGSYMRANLKDYSRQDSAKLLVEDIQQLYSEEPSKVEEFNKAYNNH